VVNGTIFYDKGEDFMSMSRASYVNKLILWKNSQNRLPLVLWGARQVGKTHLMQSFAKTHYQTSVYLNFERNKDLASLFERSLDSQTILRNLSIYFN
jgi:predicted AAA+ superfamily ATPase